MTTKTIFTLYPLESSGKVNQCGGGSHYANMSVQYAAIFHSCINGNFSDEKCDNFLIFAQNIDCGYTLEPPH